jgi:hypothetical protein
MEDKGWRVQRLAYTGEVAGSTPASPTIFIKAFALGAHDAL